MEPSTIVAMEVIKGRMYDYNNGRFLSVDPFITNPSSTQALNPYTYIFNNPLSGVDPTGYKPVCVLKCSDWNSVKKLSGILTNLSITFTNSNGASQKFTIALTDQAISEIGNIIKDNLSGLTDRGDIIDLLHHSDAVELRGELQSFRAVAIRYQEMTDERCNTGCDDIGRIPKVFIAQFEKISEMLAYIGTMGTGLGVSTTTKIFTKSARMPVKFVPNPHGRLGSPLTQNHVSDVALYLQNKGWTIKGGGGMFKEEYLAGINGGRKGSSFIDITAVKNIRGNERTLRVNTIDTRVDKVTPTTREATNAARIKSQTPGDPLLLIPKPKTK